MTEKRFELVWKDTGEVLHDNETGLDKGIYSPDYRFHVRDMMNELSEENEQLKQENKKLHDRIFAMRTNEALDRTLISEKDWKNPREFLENLDQW